ncbi:MAG TPA: glycosyltransferase family 39 protein [Jatrophihabitantaceae bacterium]|nr:glycosyltransferase family 39 protein [Jatrophihabitantaceae bacterium]
MTTPVVAPLARRPVFSATLVVGVILTVFSAGYGYHRDELYFRMLPNAWGFVDQPPLTPMLAHGFSALFADATWAIRIPATMATMATIVLVALLTREFGGGRGAQTLSAWGYASASIPMIMGHALLTSTIDLPVWPAIVLFIARAILRDQPRWWLAAGAVVGISLYNKLLVAVLLVALAVGVLLVGPRRLLVSRWVLGATALALVIGSPNLIYQATHGWPQFKMGRALARNNGSDVRILMWPFLIIMLGPPLIALWIAGLRWLWQQPALRFIAAGFPVLLVLVFVMGAQFYYPFGLQVVLYAAGCVPAARWLAHRRGWRTAMVVGIAVNAAVSLLIALPLVPVSTLSDTPIPGINQVARDSIGWPRYVGQIAEVYARVPSVERPRTIVYASNYGEAGAVDRYGGQFALPRVYSGQNALHFVAEPPSAATTVVFVGGQYDDARPLFTSCRVETHLDDGVGVDNEEQGEPVAICRDPIGGWRRVWPKLAHLD